ncbi:uncharacterized protein [Littorina saxatilis]|uniref:DUF7043 domain-containing protein n=2 Tax=Littorina saxatilis TaxID=31220 RepID=A0AAN9AIX1_9CAEN
MSEIYSMRITDSELGENGCNYMHRPMKFESDCLTGEGVLFDFISEGCLPSSAAMFVKQRTLPVATWRHGGDHFVILRRRDDLDLYCLRIPKTSENHLNAFLFTDLACLTRSPRRLLGIPLTEGDSEVKYLVLHLQMYVYRHLCDDEYPQCSAVTCNSYIRHECHKSCKVCDADNPPATCSFPRRIRGDWYQMDTNGFNRVNVTESDVIMENMGSFRCVVYPDSPSRRTKMYTTVSMFKNGCRPRYTCVKFKRLGPSVLRYTLSRSYVWPDLMEKFGESICSDDQFGMDPEPIRDLYRTTEDTGKPIISHNPALERVPCNLSSSFSLTATFPNGSLCHGSLFEHCEDSTRLRLHFHSGCGQVISRGETISSLPYNAAVESSNPGPWVADYACLAHYEGHYWERVLMLRNVKDKKDARCLLFTQMDASEAMMMVAGQCDKNAWNYARVGMRTPLLSLRLRPDEFPCKYLPLTTTTTTMSSTALATSGGGRMESLTGRLPGGRRGGQTQILPVSFSVTLPPSPGGPKHRISAAYEEPKGRERTPIDYNPELSPRGNDSGSGRVASSAGGIALAPLILLAAYADWISR